MNLYSDLPLRASGDIIRVVVEVPRGSSVKLKYNPELKLFEWSRALSIGVTFPYDYGFLPQTIGGDGEGLDAVVLAEVGSYPGVVVPSRVVGALRVVQKRDGQAPKRNDRIVVVPVNEHRHSAVANVTELPERLRQELEAFFGASLLLTGKRVEFQGFADATEALELVAAAEERYAQSLVKSA